MRFNRFIFDCFLESAAGRQGLEFFNNFNEYIIQANFEKINKFIKKQNYITPEDYLLNFDKDEVAGYLDLALIKKTCNPKKKKLSIQTAYFIYKKFLIFFYNNNKIHERDILRDIYLISMLLYAAFPEYFAPYFFNSRFYTLEKIFGEFNIALPRLPAKRDYKARVDYYYELCKSLYDFRKEMGFSSVELNVFLYYFAPHFIDDIKVSDEIPPATKVYICGADNEDANWIKKTSDKDICMWQGNVNSIPGDIYLIYEVKPNSAIKSIWQAITPGFYDPFEYFTPRVWIGHPIKIPPISFEELQNNALWGVKGVVKAHMQGINGYPCSREEYNEIKNILQAKGFDISCLPSLADVGFDLRVEINNEKDVEELLLEPLLNKLGFTSKDWMRQMPIRMGRGERVYPDYVLFPKSKKGEESGWFLWEAKYSIRSKNALLDAFWQAKSYALRLNALGFGLISLEGVWIALHKDNFSFSDVIHYSWNEINNSDCFNKIQIIFINIGRQASKAV